MKRASFILLFFICLQANSQSVIGKWKTIDDKTGKPKSIVKIYENDGKIYGKVIEILDPEKREAKCEKCVGANKNVPILGLTIINGLTKDGQEYSGGIILDPQSGNQYKCVIKLLGNDKLDVRGYMGVSFFGRSQTWIRLL